MYEVWVCPKCEERIVGTFKIVMARADRHQCQEHSFRRDAVYVSPANLDSWEWPVTTGGPWRGWAGRAETATAQTEGDTSCDIGSS